jgi:uncharacterized protein YcbX
MIKVTEINIYPLKSCRGIGLPSGEVTKKGFASDRQYLIVDKHGKFITQRQQPILAKIGVKMSKNRLILSFENDSFTLNPILEGIVREIQVWSDRPFAIDQGDKVAHWLGQILGQECRLVKQSPHHPRIVDQKYAPKPTDEVSFADGYPYLLTNTASLDYLNEKLPQPIPMNRFRPNLVVDTDQAFIEDSWKTIKIGEVIFDIVKPCSRCIITTTDQLTGERNNLREPLRTLSDFRQTNEGQIIFGMNMIPRGCGIVNIGDEVII